jgi:putative ABC transport system permease protein
MFRYLPLIAKNSIRNRRRSILTILSVAASLCLLGVLMAIYQAFFFGQPSPDQALRLITRNKVSLVFPMPIYYGEKIRKVPGVRDLFVSQWYGGVYKDARDQNNFFARFAVQPEHIFNVLTDMKLPDEEKRAFQQDRAGALVGRTLAERLKFKVGDRLTLKGDIFPGDLEFTIRAIYDMEENNETFYFHLQYLFESLPAGRRDFAGTFSILGDSVESVPRIARDIDEIFRNSSVQTRTETEKAFQLSFVSFLGNVKMFLLSICGAVTFTILLVSANTMAMTVRERIREVGILKTLGFTPASILGIILGEAAFISLIGGLLGAGLAVLMCGVVRQMPAFLQELKTLTIEPPVFAACLGAAMLIGLISAFVPAWSASRTPILESLRHTG